MHSHVQINGSITALATPFAASGAVDLQAWEALLDAQRAAGTQGVVVAGSTGEAAALETEELDSLIGAARARLGARVPVLVGTGGSNTAKTVRATRMAADAGADAALVVAPPYVRPTQEGMVRHFLAVAEEGGLPVVLYNVPSRTACDLLPETVERLAAHAGIVAIKEARAEPERMEALLGLRSDGFRVLSGDDPTACRAMLAGADGCISVASNAAPAAFRRLCDLARRGERIEAERLDSALGPLYAFLALEPNPIPIKALLAALGRCEDRLRLPLLPLSEAPRAQLQDIVGLVVRLEREAVPAPTGESG